MSSTSKLQQVKDIPLTGFRRFQDCPWEIRHLIWSFCLRTERHIHLTPRQKCRCANGSNAILVPPLLHINYESRSQSLQYYSRLFRGTDVPHIHIGTIPGEQAGSIDATRSEEIFLNPAIDVIHICGRYSLWSSSLRQADRNQVTKLFLVTCNNHSYYYNHTLNSDLFRQWPSLTDFTLGIRRDELHQTICKLRNARVKTRRQDWNFPNVKILHYSSGELLIDERAYGQIVVGLISPYGLSAFNLSYAQSPVFRDERTIWPRQFRSRNVYTYDATRRGEMQWIRKSARCTTVDLAYFLEVLGH